MVITEYIQPLLSLPDSEVACYLAFALLLVLLSLGLIITLYLHRAHSLSREQKYRELRFRYQYFIYDALVEGQAGGSQDTAQQRIIARFRDEELTSPLRKQVMIDLMIELKKSFTGKASWQFIELYYSLGLVNFSKAKLKKRSWQAKASGLRELSEMNCTDAEINALIIRWQKHKNACMAEEARIAAIRMHTFASLSFLDQHREILLPIQQLRLQHYLTSLPKEQLPDFTRWLSSTNESVVLFSLHMIVKLEQTTSYEKITSLFRHPSHQVKMEAIEAVKHLNISTATGKLFDIFDYNDEVLKVAALEAIGKLGSTFHASLLQPLAVHAAPPVRTSAARAIQDIKERCGTESKKRQTIA
ncbi:MAG: HEAT repeat domain-containing protein [Cyclobacteriaceae bacterium]